MQLRPLTRGLAAALLALAATSAAAETDNEKAANGPLPGDLALTLKEEACTQALKTPGDGKGLHRPAGERSQLARRASQRPRRPSRMERGQTSWIIANRKAVVSPNSSTPFSASKAPIICQGGASETLS
jgi:hypothetical protein